jgi:quinoprotein glucose dehydrogenase
MKKITFYTFLAISLAIISAFVVKKNENDPANDWPDYLGGADRNHYSKLTQINPENVGQLKIAWTYSLPDSGQMQVNPLVINGIVYGVSSSVQAFALDATTGKEIWRFGDPYKNWASTSRGVSYWKEGNDERIFITMGPKLYAIDAKTGKNIKTFGENGSVDLHTGLPKIAQEKFVMSNTPGTIFEDLIVMPVRLSEGSDAAPGDLRAFNVKTGKLVWTFHTIPYPGEFGYETFPKNAYKNESVGAANNWAGMAVDKKRGIIYVPTGSAAYDFYGGNRKGKNLFANCLLALNARTGKRLWHYQTMHHDVWDRDHPAPPNLVTLKHNGKMVDAVAQVTKQGYVFVFDRVTGKPLFPIKELPALKSDIPGETLWPTQPIPTKPAPYARQSFELKDDDISIYAENREELLQKWKTYRRAQFSAPSKEGTVILPGYDGGAEWGGSAVDPEGVIYINSNEMPWILTMVAAPKKDALAALPLGERTYKVRCSQCHGDELKGNPKSNYPSLVNIGKKLDRQAINTLVANGKGMMPGFNFLKADEKQALTEFLSGLEKKEITANNTAKEEYTPPFQSTGYNKFLDKNGHPAITPPWGTLNAIDLNTGEYVWKIPFGNEPNLAVKGTGTENYGGPVITASGLLFIAATKDGMFRAFEKKTGKLLWETQLPFAAFATPATYAVNGKQYIVLACGGTKLGTPKGNMYVAYALP